MEIGLTILKVTFFLSLVMVGSCTQSSAHPRTCDHVECPTYKLVESKNGYEIRVYDSAVWMTTGPISSPSMTKAATTSFQQLYSYIQGNNKSKTKMNMTAPVIIEATPGKSAYIVFFYLPKKNQPNPPQAEGLNVQRWNPTYVTVKQFGGYVSDVAAKKEVAALMVSLKGSKWIVPIEKSRGKSPAYLVAGYNPPFQTTGRVNEIMVPFDM